MAENFPKKPEQYSNPSRLSYFIQSKVPWAYDPPPELFAVRFSGIGTGVYATRMRGILGPDCRKLLLYPGEDRNGVIAPPSCLVDERKLTAYAESVAVGAKEPVYKRLSKEVASDLELVVAPEPYKVGVSGNGNFILGRGWDGLEVWGVWSQSK